MAKERVYICIDLKSFFASVECVERGLDPMTTNLVVADPDRSERTICLAITPAMKKLGVKNRCRVFQIPDSVDYLMATPRMQYYIDYSARIYGVYLKYIAKEDIHVYSIDEVFMDVTNYLHLYQMTPKELAVKIMKDVYDTTGITATCGIGTNMYLAKIALDITAKHVPDNIGILDEKSYQEKLWNHRPLTDFWRVGSGIAKRLEKYGIYTMGDIAKTDEDFLYKLFGIDAELLIDHAWGRETATIADIKKYKSSTHSLSSGQVLMRDYGYDEGRLIVKEMADLLCLELVDKELITDYITMNIGYSARYEMDGARGSIRLDFPTSSAKVIMTYVERLYNEIADKNLSIRRFNISFNNVVHETYHQYDIFSNPEELKKEHDLQKAMLDIKNKYGKNAILKGMNLSKEGTTMERNRQIGGHRSGS